MLFRSLAGGNIDDANDFTGIAPEARFIIVKLKQAKQYLRKFYRIPDKVPAFQENDIMLAMTYLGYKAGEVYTPLSVYLGLGTSSGDHNGDSPLSTVIKTLGSYRGVCISVAAGNEGNQGHHYLGNVDMNRYEDVEIRVGENDEGFTLELWAVTPNLYSVAIISPSGEISDRVRPRSDHTITISYVLEPTTIYVSYENPETSTGNELVLMRFTTLISGVWRIRVYNETNSGSEYHMWLPISNFLSDDTYFLRPDPYITLVETGTAARAISTAAFNNKNNSIYIKSRRGYTLAGLIKPDIAAPGVNIYGPVGKNSFGIKSGTSVAAAQTAGIAALLLEWGSVEGNRPKVNTTEIKTLLIRGATRSGRNYPNQEWGYGGINIYGTFQSLRSDVSNAD